MKSKAIIISVFTVILISLMVLGAGFSIVRENAEPEISEELQGIDPTDMSQYYSMGEYYPPNDVDTINIDWQGGRVEITAYNGSDYFVEEAATRYLRENERLANSLEGSAFSVHFTESAETVIDDAYKKLEIRIPLKSASSLKGININTNGEVVLKNITAENITIHGNDGNIRAENTYANSAVIETTSGNVGITVNNDIGYSVDFTTKKGKLDSYVDNGLNKYVSGDGKYAFSVKTKTGDLSVDLAIEENT